jgi:two-component system, OmpR family, sensor histidine kinase KdpD
MSEHCHLSGQQLSNPATIMRVKINWRESTVRFLAVVALVAVIVKMYRQWLPVNPTTVALTFLLAVLIVSTFWGLRYAVLLALLATLSFNYFFLPPIGTLTVADPQNWVALLAFLITAILASELSERARRETANANQRRRDVERLYAFSQRLLATDNLSELLNAIPDYVCQIFGGKSAAMYLLSSKETYRTDPRSGLSADDLKAVATRGEPVIEHAQGLAIAPLRLGARLTGAIGILGTTLSRETLEALGSLVAIAIERVGVVEKLSKAEAERESENLRTALLDSVTHELRTPLTGIKAAVTALLSDSKFDETERRELLTVINEESDRLDRLVGEATEMAQLDAHGVELHREPMPIGSVIEAALEQSKGVLGSHPVEIRVPESLPKVSLDAVRIAEALKLLLENAAKYSPANAPITISAEMRDSKLITSVSDQGPGIDDYEQTLIFDKFYRGRDQRYSVQGTGMGLAITKAIVEAHGGTISVVSQLGHGSVFSFSLPAS